jgi:hypothetical protein
MANYGFKAVSEGNNVLTTEDVSKIYFSSRYESFKTSIRGTRQLNGSATLDITHNFKYVPIFLIYAQSSFNTNFKLLCTADRTKSQLRTRATTSYVTLTEWSGVTRSVFVDILENPVSVY